MELVPVLRRPDRGCGTVMADYSDLDVLRQWWNSPIYQAGERGIASVVFPLSAEHLDKRATVELFFNCCIECRAHPREKCTCHDEGKGTG